MTDGRVPTPTSKPLLWAAGAASIYVAAMVTLAVGCATGLSRLDNQLAIAIAVACIATIVRAALRHSARLRLAAQLVAGVLAGMYFQPSTALVLSLFVLVMSTLSAWRCERRLLAMCLAVVGFVMGLAITYGLLMRIVAPTSIGC